jgi:hypothetical protein
MGAGFSIVLFLRSAERSRPRLRKDMYLISFVFLAMSLFLPVQQAFAETLTYSNSVTDGSWYTFVSGNEIIDYATSSGGYVSRFVIRYATRVADPGKVIVRFYSGTNIATCPGVFLQSFELDGLEGLPDGLPNGTAYWYEKEFAIPLRDQFFLPAGDFGYSYEFDNGDSGPVLASGGSNNDIYYWRFLEALGGWSKVFLTGSWEGFFLNVYVDPRNDPALSDIEGYTFDDVNVDGIWDAGELGLGGWEIYLDTNDNGQYEASEPNTVTDPNGFYEFVGLSPGVYTVVEIMQDGWAQIYPAGDGTHRLITDPNVVYSNNDFGNKSDWSADIELPVGVGVEDVLLMASQWLESTGSPSADIAPAALDGRVDYLDFEVLSRQWLTN